LKYQIQRDRIYRVFKPASEKTRAVRIQQNPAVTQAGIEDSGIAATARNRMAAPSPHLNFASAFLGSDLGKRGPGAQQENGGQLSDTQTPSHRRPVGF
jgi:hypothetical protein